MEKYYTDTCFNVVSNLDSDIDRGLKEYECIVRREKENNKIDLPCSKRKLKIILEVLKEISIYVYLLFIIVYIVNDKYIMAGILNLILLVNIAFKIYDEIKYENKINLLENLNKAYVSVIREGHKRLVEIEELVKGDIVYFKKNSVIGADLRIIESENLKVNEISVTGEELIKEKHSTKLDRKVKDISEINNMLFRGSIIKEGFGKGIVVEVGNKTEFAKLIKVMKNKKNNLLVKSIQNNIFKILLCLILFQVIVTLILPRTFTEKKDLLLQGIFIMISIPIPIILNQYNKYLKIKVLNENKIEINNLSILKDIDNIKIIFINKLKNITKNELYVDKLYTNEQIYSVNKIDISDINIKRLIDISIICNNGVYNRDISYIKGDLFEKAYMTLGVDNSIHKPKLDALNIRKLQIPISKDRNIQTTVNKYKKYYRANIRGNVESILERCTHIIVNGIEREINAEDLIKIKLADVNFSKEGLITEGVAYRNFNYEPSIQENIESNLVFVGIIALENPIIDNIADDINLLIKNKILPIIFTDNNKISAEVLGKRISLINNEEAIVCEGDLVGLNNKEFLKRVSNARIYCDLSLKMKNKIVSLYKKDGYDFVIEGNSLVDLSLITLSNIGVVKSKISKILESLGDIYTEENTIKSFIELKKISSNVEESINRGLLIYTILTLCNLIFLDINYLVSNRENFNLLNQIIGNFLIIPCIILLNSVYGKYIKNNKILIFKTLEYIIIVIGGTFINKEKYSFIYFLIVSVISIIDIIINSNKVNNKNYYKGKWILLLLIGISILIGINILILNLALDIINLMIILWLIIIFLICDFIIRKCQ